VEANVASGVDTEVLMASYVEDNNSQGKNQIFYYGSTVHVYSQKELFNSLIVKKKGTIKMIDGSVCKVIGTGQSRLQKEMRQCVLWRQSGMSRRHSTI